MKKKNKSKNWKEEPNPCSKCGWVPPIVGYDKKGRPLIDLVDAHEHLFLCQGGIANDERRKKMKMIVSTKEEIIKTGHLTNQDFVIRPFPCPHCKETVVIGYFKESKLWIFLLGVMVGGACIFGWISFFEYIRKII